MLILHDLEDDIAKRIATKLEGGSELLPSEPDIHACVGCFGCWLKTPGECVIDDKGREYAKAVRAHRDVAIISRLTYGGYSPSVKAALDRSIGNMLPYFSMRNGEMHHRLRYPPNRFACYFYGEDISDRQMAIARRLVKANAINLGCESFFVGFYKSFEELEAAF